MEAATPALALWKDTVAPHIDPGEAGYKLGCKNLHTEMPIINKGHSTSWASLGTIYLSPAFPILKPRKWQ